MLFFSLGKWVDTHILNIKFLTTPELNVLYFSYSLHSYSFSVVWTALLSAWYPPEAEKEKDCEEKKD